MPRRIANALTLLSAVVCVLSAMGVGRSFFRLDAVSISAVKNSVTRAATIDAQLWLMHGPGSSAFVHVSRPRAASRADASSSRSSFRGIPRLGIGWGSMSGFKYLILPLWLLPLLTAIAPVRWWRKRQREAGRGFPVAGA